MQPVQDLTVEDRVSRTQYQYTLEDADAERAEPRGRRGSSTRCSALPRAARRRAATSRTRGCSVTLVIDRDTASRLGITPQMIDDTLYDAFGQRQVSTIFTQLNQYRVVLEVEPEFQQGPQALQNIYVRSRERRRRCRLSAFTQVERDARRRSSINHQGQFPAVTLSFNLAPGRVARRRGRRRSSRPTQEIGLPASIQASFQGTAQAFQASLANEPLLILAALVTVYIVLGVLYESYIHPLTILSTLPSAGVGALLALMLCRHRPRASSRSSASSC